MKAAYVEANLSFHPTAVYSALQTANPTFGDDSGSSAAAPGIRS
jgi:hypothetical protein